ncbi:MAG TPA: hypothetical protein VGN17_14065 [Bryobacteraceae bacterium]|jgi:hypothetical protein
MDPRPKGGLLACLAIFLATLALRAALLPWMPIPAPIIHDEFSYLLAGDTYAHGRLVNPPHPFWEHFETFQVMQQPVYASKYQPLQGMVLAFGEKFFHQPWIGVWLSTALLCAAICWMLQGWISLRWAVAASALFALRVGVLSYWMNSYEGGAVPGIGGALALGALPRIAREGQWKHSITWAFGLGILALSRPYDAAVTGIASGVVLLWWSRKSFTIFEMLRRVAMPALLVSASAGAAIAYNDVHVTGKALTLPYVLHDRQYVVASMFAFLPLSPVPEYRHAPMREFYASSNVSMWNDVRTEPFTQMLAKLSIFQDFFFGFWLLTVPLLLWPSKLDSAESRFTLLLLGACLLAMLPLIAVVPHYVAAFAGVLSLRFAQNWSRLSGWSFRGQPWGRWFAVSLAGWYVLAFCNTAQGLIRQGESPAMLSAQDSMSRRFGERDVEFGFVRNSIAQRLAKLPAKQLVLVRYSPDHNVQNEWVYNAADVDASPVVWAREMGPAEDRPFLQYFHERQAWLLEADRSPPKLTPYHEPK